MLVIKDSWTTDNDSTTPSLKIKRHILEQRYNDKVAALRVELYEETDL